MKWTKQVGGAWIREDGVEVFEENLGKVPPAGMRVDRNGHVWGWTYTNGNKAYTTATKAKRAADAVVVK